MNSKELIKLIKQDGWYIVRVRGSHNQFKHPSKPGTVTIPHPKKISQRKLSNLCLNKLVLNKFL